MTNDEKARARFFMRVGQSSGPWRDANTMPLFPLLMVMDAAMLDADAEYEGTRKAFPAQLTAEGSAK
jgi:hypothetical protein